MVQLTEIEKKRLWELTQQGKSAEEMMKTLDIQTPEKGAQRHEPATIEIQ